MSPAAAKPSWPGAGKLLAPLRYWSGAYGRAWRRAVPCAFVIAYHRLLPASRPSDAQLFGPERGLAVPVFDAHLRFLLRHFTPVSVARLLGDPDALPPLCFAVTFDDGYADGLELAAPVLRRHGVPATFYANTDYVGTERLFWWEQLADCLRETRQPELAVASAVPGLAAPARLALGDLAERGRAHEILVDALRWLAPAELDTAVARLAEALGRPRRLEGRAFPLLGWEDLATLRRQGFEIGGHGASHASLGRCPEADLEREVRASLRILEDALGEPVTSFAYPYGGPEHRGPAAIRAVRESGCLGAFTTEAGVVTSASDRYQLPRLELNQPWSIACAYNIQKGVGAVPVDRSH